MSISDFLEHKLFLALVVPLIGIFTTWLSRIINQARFKSYFDAHRKKLHDCAKAHIEVLNKIGADEVVIMECSNGGSLPSMKNNWGVSAIKCYRKEEDGSTLDVVRDWQKHPMDDGYWDMVCELLNEKVIAFPSGKKPPSTILKEAHELYGIESFVLTEYFYKRRFLFMGKSKVILARWGFKEGNALRMQTDNPDRMVPEIGLILSNRRNQLAEFWKK